MAAATKMGSPALPCSAAVPAGFNAPASGTSGVSGIGEAGAAKSGPIPDHAVLMMSVTKDELRTTPEFRHAR
jgi:hypothetical protein